MRYCTCNVRRPIGTQNGAQRTGISGGMHSMAPTSNVSYSYRSASSNNGDVNFLAGVVVGAIVAIVVVCVVVFLF